MENLRLLMGQGAVIGTAICYKHKVYFTCISTGQCSDIKITFYKQMSFQTPLA